MFKTILAIAVIALASQTEATKISSLRDRDGEVPEHGHKNKKMSLDDAKKFIKKFDENKDGVVQAEEIKIFCDKMDLDDKKC
jgi:Ca2+-binding EF-hand superfamily protein